MSKVTTESIQKLAQRYEQIMNGLQSLAGAKESSQASVQPELLAIIHRPGWTTVQDVALFHAGLDALEQQVNAIEKLHAAIAAGARNGLQQAAA